MSKNKPKPKTSTLDNPIFAKISAYMVVFCSLILIAIYSKTHDPSIPPILFFAAGALALPEVIRMVKSYIAFKKERERERIHKEKEAKKEAERIANMKALIEKEFNEGRLEGKMQGVRTLNQRQAEKDIH